MPFRSNIHTHTIYSDGTSTAEEYVRAALNKGFVSLGFSEHAYAPYDLDCCIRDEGVRLYHSEVKALARRWAGQLEIYCGLEVDWYNLVEKDQWDFIIGSVHYLRSEKTGRYYTIDYTEEILEQAVRECCEGDMRALVEQYIALVVRMAADYRPNILGHIDLITKLNKNDRYFDTASGWYKDLWDHACEQIARSGCIVEINTGAITRGYTDRPYPDIPILERLYALRVPITICSDAHNVRNLDGAFDLAVQTARDVGYSTAKMLRGGRFVEVEL